MIAATREFMGTHTNLELNACDYATSIINKKNELNIMVDYIKPHIIYQLGLAGYVMFRKDITGRIGRGVLLYIKETIPAYEVQFTRGSILQ